MSALEHPGVADADVDRLAPGAMPAQFVGDPSSGVGAGRAGDGGAERDAGDVGAVAMVVGRVGRAVARLIVGVGADAVADRRRLTGVVDLVAVGVFEDGGVEAGDELAGEGLMPVIDAGIDDGDGDARAVEAGILGSVRREGHAGARLVGARAHVVDQADRRLPLDHRDFRQRRQPRQVFEANLLEQNAADELVDVSDVPNFDRSCWISCGVKAAVEVDNNIDELARLEAGVDLVVDEVAIAVADPGGVLALADQLGGRTCCSTGLLPFERRKLARRDRYRGENRKGAKSGIRAKSQHLRLLESCNCEAHRPAPPYPPSTGCRPLCKRHVRTAVEANQRPSGAFMTVETRLTSTPTGQRTPQGISTGIGRNKWLLLQGWYLGRHQFAGNDVGADARLLVVTIFPCEGASGAVLLGSPDIAPGSACRQLRLSLRTLSTCSIVGLVGPRRVTPAGFPRRWFTHRDGARRRSNSAHLHRPWRAISSNRSATCAS